MEYLTSGPSLAMELVKKDAVNAWRELLGPIDSEKAQEFKPNSMRARFGQDDIRNVGHGSSTLEESIREVNFFFPKSRMYKKSILTPETHSSNSNKTTCCVIKPHAFHMAGEIIQAISEAEFQILGIATFHLDFGKADEFLEVYKGVLENYGDIVKELSSGVCMVLEIGSAHGTPNEDVVSRFRDFCGPQDSELAKLLRPTSLRARFGENLNLNAVHCTDLPDDGPLEVEYFFKVLQ